MNKLVQCDCCDYFSILSGEGYEICPICFWEQDYFGIEEPDTPSGANHGLSIREGRANFQNYGACTPELVKSVVPEYKRALYKCVPRAI
ncbi:CPCC family cysteine-rich protein [Chitinibacter sp. ZOR0017]|uniref:CPCC family cysteine-rich protein n=1 Tax=Chitinibacter sp. ZOR0017 TaxID=1339254 RepID=UPI0009E04315|nr:CPCC family cysteine-rich protein [Chitinibacter sp. ZOR0017]